MAAQAQSVTLVGSTVSTFTLTGVKRGDRVDVTNHGAGTVYVRLDNVDPVAAADENFPVLAGTSRRFSLVHANVKVISAGTPVVTVSKALG